MVPFAHEYLVTQPFRERSGAITSRRCVTRTSLIYLREEGGGLIMGGYERESAPWALDEQLVDRIPANFNGRLLEEDWPRFEEIADNSPAGGCRSWTQITVHELINGPEAFTPDNGSASARATSAACSSPPASAPTASRAPAGSAADGRVDPGGRALLDVWEMDIRRFGAHYRSPAYTLKRTKEVYETYYDIRYPGPWAHGGAAAAVSSATSGTSSTAPRSARSPAGSGSTGTRATRPRGDESLRPRGWAGMHWSPAIGAEHRATREAAGLFDESSFAKLELAGPGAAELLERLCDNRVARDVGQITYTQMLNSRGGIECDFTVTRVGEELFQIVTGTAFANHDAGWIRSHLPGGRVGEPDRCDLTLGLLRPVGSAGARRAGAADARSARLRVHADA